MKAFITYNDYRRSYALVALFILFSMLPICGHAQTESLCEFEMIGTEASAETRAKYLESTFVMGTESLSLADLLGRRIVNLPSAERERWIQAIIDAYEIVARGRPGPPQARTLIGGKRSLDRMLFWVQNQAEAFSLVKSPSQARAIFDQMIEQQTRRFSTKCTAADIRHTVASFQHILQQWQRQHPRGAPRSLTIGGSFINGKWRAGSDIDVTFSDMAMSRDMMGDLQKAALAGVSSECTPQVQAHTEGKYFYGKLNALALEIHPETLRLHVFKPAAGGTYTNLPATGEFRTFEFN